MSSPVLLPGTKIDSQDGTPIMKSLNKTPNARDPAICPTDDEAVVPRKHGNIIDKRSLDYVIRSGIAGGLAGCAAKTLVGPLDRVKILFQASNPQFAKYSGSWFGVVQAMRDIYSHDGSRGLFRGHSATLLRIFPYAGVKFLAYEQIRAFFIRNKEQEVPWRRFLSGSLAGVTSVFITYPLEVVRVRLAFETKKNAQTTLRGICHDILNEQKVLNVESSAVLKPVSSVSGVANFYRGFSPTLLGMLPYAGMSFLTHDMAGDWLRSPVLAPYTTLPQKTSSNSMKQTESNNPSRPQLKVWAELLSGGLAGMVSQTASYPLEVIRRRMQVGGAVGDRHMMKISETARLIWAERGFRGFFIGLGIGYFKIVPMTATSFFVYERAKVWLGI